MAKVDTNVEVTLKKVRLSFEHIFKAQVPRPDKDGKIGAASFNCSFLISKKDGKMLDEIEDAIEECKKKMWGDKPPKIRSDRTPYKDGEDYEYDGYPGNMVISARNQRAPQVVHSKKDEDGKFIRLDGSEGVIYSGCYVNAIVRFWAQDSNDYGKRVNCSLEVVQFYGDGDAFSGASKVDAEDRLSGLEGKVEDDDPRTEGRRRERDRDGDGGGRRERSRDADEAPRRSRERDEDEAPRRDRGRDADREDSGRRSNREDDDGRDAPRRNRDAEDEDRGGRSRDREGGRDRDGRDSGRGRDRDEGGREERPRSSRDDGDREPRRSSRDADEDDRGSRGRARSERGDDRDGGRDRERSRGREEDDRGSREGRSRSSSDRDDEAPRRDRERDRDRDSDRPSRSSGRGRDSDLI